MAYAILRTAKLKTGGNIGGLNNHLTRTMEVPNADAALTRFNYRPVGSPDLHADVKARLLEAGIVKPRKDAVLAVEHLMTASAEHFKAEVKTGANGEKTLYLQKERWRAFQQSSIEWLQQRYGAKNVVNVTVHMDEQTPHLHAIVVPIDARGKLNCKAFLGGREKLRDMQTSFAEKMKPQGLERGLEGSKARHQEVKHFYGQVKDFYYQVPSSEIKLSPPQTIEVKPPEKGFLGIGGQDPAEKAQQESERINREVRLLTQRHEQEANARLQRLYQAAALERHSKQREHTLQGKLDALNKQIKGLQEDRKQVGSLLRAVANGTVKPEELKQGIEHIPQKEDKRQQQVRSVLEQAGVEIKQPQFKQERGRGLGL